MSSKHGSAPRRSRLALTSALLAMLSCRSISPDAASSLNVIGGRESRLFPQVGLILQKGGPYCTGTLIAARRVVTAAHCLVDATEASLQFVMEDETTGARTQLAVARIAVHPRYDAAASNHDLGLIELASDAPYPPLPVARTLNAMALLGSRLTAVGYGRNLAPADAPLGEAGSGSKRSAALAVTAVNTTKIRTEEEAQSACNGDSGGALLQLDAEGKATLAGVISCGDPTCKSFGVATRTDAFAGFLGLPDAAPDRSVAAACGAPFGRSHCEQNTVKFCSNDCYEATLASESCPSSTSCRQDPITGRAHCYDPTQWQTVTFDFKKLVIRDGAYVAGPELNDLFIFVDRDANSSRPRLDEPHAAANREGEVTLDLSLGRHHLVGLQLQGSNATAFTPPIDVKVERGVTRQTLVLPMDPVRLEVTSDVGWGQAIYVTGQGQLLGDWREAERLVYDRQKGVWIYEGVLARGLEFKLVKAAWQDQARIRLDAGRFTWEAKPGNRAVGEGGMPFTGVFRHAMTPKF